MTVDIPDKADEWPFEAKAAAICEVNTTDDVRKEIDGLAGISDPNWKGNDSTSNQFTKYEMTLILLALGGPQ